MRKRIFRAIAVTALSITLTIVFSTNLPSFKGVFDLLDGDQNQETEENVEPLRGETRSISDYSSQDPESPIPTTEELIAYRNVKIDFLDSGNNPINYASLGAPESANTTVKLKLTNNNDQPMYISSVAIENVDSPAKATLNVTGWEGGIALASGGSNVMTLNLSTTNGKYTENIDETKKVKVSYYFDDTLNADTSSKYTFTETKYVEVVGRMPDELNKNIFDAKHPQTGNILNRKTYLRIRFKITEQNTSSAAMNDFYKATSTGNYVEKLEEKDGYATVGDYYYTTDYYVNTSKYPTFDQLPISWRFLYPWSPNKADATDDDGDQVVQPYDADFTVVNYDWAENWYMTVNDNIKVRVGDGTEVTGNYYTATAYKNADDAATATNGVTAYTDLYDDHNSDDGVIHGIGIPKQGGGVATMSLTGSIPSSSESPDGFIPVTVTIPVIANATSGSRLPSVGNVHMTIRVHTYTDSDISEVANLINTPTPVDDFVDNTANTEYENATIEANKAISSHTKTAESLSSFKPNSTNPTRLELAQAALPLNLYSARNVLEQTHIQKVSDLNSANNQTETVYRVYDKNATYSLPYKESFKYPTNTSQQGKFTNTLTGTITKNLTAEYDYWKINLTDLNTAISNAEAKIADPDGIYTDDSKQALQDRIDEIKADIASLENINNSPTSQSEINALTSEINNYQLEYKTLLSFYDENGTTLLKEVRAAQGETTLTALGVNNPTKDPTKEKQFEFNGWVRQSGNSTISGDQISVDDDTVFYASYSESNRIYRLKFYNYNSETGQNDILFCEQDVTYSQAWTPCYSLLPTPEREPTTESVFTFTNWYPDVPSSPFEVSGSGVPTRFEARYAADDRPYNVIFHNGDGSVLQAYDEEHGNQIPYGTTPEYTGSIVPSKQATAQYTYTFSGNWDPEIQPVQGNIDYNPIFNETVNEYTITFKNYDGTILESKQVAYGETPTYTGQTPEKPSDSEFNYEFSSWDPTIHSVTCETASECNATYTATFEGHHREYEVKFEVRGSIVDEMTQIVEYGATPQNVSDPDNYQDQRYNYTFDEWRCSFTDGSGTGYRLISDPIIKPTTCIAKYTKTTRQYLVRFYNVSFNERGEKTSQNYDMIPATYGEYVTPPLNPTTPSTQNKYYIFDDWIDEQGNPIEISEGKIVVLGNKTYTATYEEHTFKTITFKNEDGTILSEKNDYRDGETPVYSGETPTKPADVQYTYTFSGWTDGENNYGKDEELPVVSSDKTYIATYTSTVNEYTIKFVNEDGTELQKGDVAYGQTPTYTGETPTKPATPQYTYTFSGWTPEITAVTGEATYTATYSETTNQYSVIFYDEDGETILKEATNYDYGTSATDIVEPETPTKPATPQYTYTFSGWTPEITDITCDDAEDCNRVYTATYSSTVNEYAIRFVNEDGTELQNSNVAYGETPTYNGATPEKEADAQYTYTFDKWTPEISAVTCSVSEDCTKTYTATYTSTVNKYTIKFVNEDGTELQNSEIEYGETPVYSGSTPEKPADAQYTYTFDKWAPEITSVTGEATYTATYTSEVNKYFITFANEDGTQLQKSEVEYGQTPVYAGETPTKDADVQNTYTFSGWNPEITSVTGEATYEAVFEPKQISYTITFKDYDGTVISEKTYHYNDTVEVPEDPTRESTPSLEYTFTGWDKEIHAVTGNETYTATYEGKAYDVEFRWIENQTYTIGEDKEAVFKIEIAKKFFAHRVEVDGKVIQENKDYIITEGSTVVTLQKSFLDTLAVGIHSLDIYYDDEVVISTTFRIEKPAPDTPDTDGDEDDEKDDGKDSDKKDDKDSDKNGGSSEDGKNGGLDPDTGFFTGTTDFAKLSIVFPILIVTASTMIIVKKKRINKN